STKRQKSETLTSGNINKRSAYGEERRRLVIASPECARHPAQLGNAHRSTDAGVGCILRQCSFKMRQPHPAVERQPAGGLVLLFQKNSRHRAPQELTLSERRRRVASRSQRE